MEKLGTDIVVESYVWSESRIFRNDFQGGYLKSEVVDCGSCENGDERISLYFLLRCKSSITTFIFCI